MEESTITDVLEFDNYEWEAQFVGDSRVPFHDERWPYRYRNNVQLALHLCFMDYTFSVVSDVFSVHRRIQVKGNSRDLGHMQLLQKLQPWGMKKGYNDELDRLYPGMKKKCFTDES